MKNESAVNEKNSGGGVAFLLASLIFANQALAAVPLARVVVAKSGGNYTTITAALAAINPTATAPYVIEVWPGVYTESCTVALKSYVHLKGSGRDITTIKPASPSCDVIWVNYVCDVIWVNYVNDVTISGLTITGGWSGIYARNSNIGSERITIVNNTISNNGFGGITAYMSNAVPANPALITGNNITNNGYVGIQLGSWPARVTDNIVSGNGRGGFDVDGGLKIYDAGGGSSTLTNVVTGNEFTGNKGTGVGIWGNTNNAVSGNIITGNTMVGVKFSDSSTGGNITNNKIVNNGASSYTDIDVPGSGALPNISFNIFDDITGTRGVGSYNVNSNGDLILVP